MKKYIKLNSNDEHLSLGNFFRIIKDLSKNKSNAIQTDLFSIIFNIDYIADTTVNNYLVGYRRIGDKYIQAFLNRMKKYNKDKNEFVNTISALLSIIKGQLVNNIDINYINNSREVINICNKMFNLAKNDEQVKKEEIEEIKKYLDNNKYYDAIICFLNYIILIKKQPIYEENLKKEVFENILSDSSISSSSLKKYLSLKLKEGINYYPSLKKLSKEGNAYASFELGSNEYYGYVSGKPRYTIAYDFLSIAADQNHGGACYIIGVMLIKGLLGNKTNNDLKRGYNYLKKAYSLKNIASCNVLGNMYKDGIYPLKKDLKKAVYYYNKGINRDYSFSYNNMGYLYEKDDFEKAIKYYLKSADLGESWACNKVANYYYDQNDIDKAFMYYKKSIDNNYSVVNFYAFYNLATKYYLYGNEVVKKDENKAIEYLNIAKNNHILEAYLELIKYYIIKYNKTKEKGYYYLCEQLIDDISKEDKYNNKIKKDVEKLLKLIKQEIDVKLLIDLK
ncbi:MAG: sel1 repeat family protein [Mollicutes bacterium]|nr:sel1 repeat family protein [Mollicutes bacterium]